MKYAIGAIVALLIFLAGFITGQSVKKCPEIKESIEIGKMDLPEIKREIEKPKPVKSYKAPASTGTYRHTPAPAGKDSTGQAPAGTGSPCDSINEYSETVEDSTGKVTVKSIVHGVLLKQDILWKPKISYIKETKAVEAAAPTRAFLIGLEIGSSFSAQNTMFRLAPEVEYLDKKGNAFSYNYDVLNKVHSGGFKKRIF